jgi:hypothetical protein
VRTIPVILVLLLTLAGVAPAQKEIQPIFSHRLAAEAAAPRAPRAASVAGPETLRVLAAMVAFQEDTDTRTSGNGSFDLSTSAPGVVDPAPRDKAYFENHLLFARNYFQKSSDGRLVVVGTVLDSVFRLPHPMQRYSPSRSSTTNAELGTLVADAWRAVDSLTPGIDYPSYDAFILFHAGVGRDIDLVSIYGYDPTPYDLPSLYLNLPSLQAIFGPSYEGVPVAGGSFHITSTMVLPETENREIATIGGSTLLELGINGLLAASIGSHLGLPDLFDTRTGRSGIGRFGLMDGQSIFSWNGVFPPEPSAWERAALGWTEPLTVASGAGIYELPAASLAGDDTVYRVPVSAKEYFLVENRNRDANRDGSSVTMVRGGVTTVRHFVRDTTGFNAFNQDSLYGVITDVDEFDWSLPGGVNSRTHELFDGGLLIWHIDESIIEANRTSATVNADPSARGVDLEEADGSQDIGQAYGFLSPGSGSEDGTALDFWYSGNAAPLRLRSNLFGPNSNPNSLSNRYANSHITMDEFTARGPRMQARISNGDLTIFPLVGYPKNIGSVPGTPGILAADLDADRTVELLVNASGRASAGDTAGTDGQLVAWRQDGDPFYDTPVFVSQSGAAYDDMAALDLDGDGRMEIATFRHPDVTGHVTGNALVYTPSLGAPTLLASTGLASTAPIGPFIVTATPERIVWGGRTSIGMDRSTLAFDGVVGDPFTGLSTLGETDILVGVADTVFVERSQPDDTLRRVDTRRALVGAPAVADLDRDGDPEIVVVSADGFLTVLDSSLHAFAPFPLDLRSSVASSPAIADVDGDGQNDIVVVAGHSLLAVNARGAMLDHFPVALPTSQPVLSSPVVGDIDGDGSVDICVGLMEGEIVAYTARGQAVGGFPLPVGRGVRTAPALFRAAGGKVGIAAAADDGYLYAWEYAADYDTLTMPWPLYLHDAQHSGSLDLVRPFRPISGELLPTSRTYNWPNPVGPEDGFKTHIRYYVGSDATVRITIVDQSGDVVTEFPATPASGGADQEILWDASGVQSGVYFARVEATGAGGNGVTVIKIAVVK